MTPTKEQYDAAFLKEVKRVYPVVDALEIELGFAICRPAMERAARVLACPVKKNPPCWQHGRVVYSIARKYMADHPDEAAFSFLDIGTAKGFSALCLAMAVRDSNRDAIIDSLDVLNTLERASRNTVAEVDGPKTLKEIFSPFWDWVPNIGPHFWTSTGIGWLQSHENRVHLAFVDGKHSYEAVREESELLAQRQQPGDTILFDDLQMQPVRKAVGRLSGYSIRMIKICPERSYAWAVKQ